MKNIVYSLALLVATLLVAGCQQSQPPKTQPPKGSGPDAEYYTWEVEHNGKYQIGYKLPIPPDHDNADYKASRARMEKMIEAKRKSPTDPGGADTDIKWVVPGIDFQVTDSKIKLNGKEYGTVKRGDKVRVTHDGEVLINAPGFNSTFDGSKAGGKE